jgi:hypothetical protein
MAIAQILAVGTTAADSSDVVVANGSSLAVCLKDAAGPRVALGALVHILMKDDAGQYFRVGQLNAEKPAAVIDGGGTYRFSRVAGISCGVFQGA